MVTTAVIGVRAVCPTSRPAGRCSLARSFARSLAHRSRRCRSCRSVFRAVGGTHAHTRGDCDHRPWSLRTTRSPTADDHSSGDTKASSNHRRPSCARTHTTHARLRHRAPSCTASVATIAVAAALLPTTPRSDLSGYTTYDKRSSQVTRRVMDATNGGGMEEERVIDYHRGHTHTREATATTDHRL